MTRTKLNLVTIRSPDIDRAVRFYELLGLEFTKHRHGAGPVHYATDGAEVVMEIHPLGPMHAPTTSALLGFSVESADEVLRKLTQAGATVISPPGDSPWGRMAVVADFDGHKVVLTSTPAATR